MSLVIGLCYGNPVKVPLLKSERKEKDEEIITRRSEQKEYRSGSGKIIYISGERDELKYAAKELGRGMTSPTYGDLKRLKRIGRYLAGTRNMEKHLYPSWPLKLDGKHDSDWAGDNESRKSTSGVTVKFCGATILSRSVTQATIALSAPEAELSAMVTLVCEMLFLMMFLAEIGIAVTPEAGGDSTSCQAIAKKLGPSVKAKHIDTKLLWIQNYVRNKVVKLTRSPTWDNESDILTKPCDETAKFQKFRRRLGLWSEGDDEENTEAEKNFGGNVGVIANVLRVLTMAGVFEGSRAEEQNEPQENDWYAFYALGLWLFGVLIGWHTRKKWVKYKFDHFEETIQGLRERIFKVKQMYYELLDHVYIWSPHRKVMHLSCDCDSAAKLLNPQEVTICRHCVKVWPRP